MRRRIFAVSLSAALALVPLSAAFSSVTRDSIISNAAGVGTPGFGGDGGPAAQALLNLPRDTAIGPDGSIYVVDTANHRIRRIAPNGIISTFAGNGSTTYNGDGIPAVQASLNLPDDVTVDSQGVVYIADASHHRIRRVGLDGIITTLAGTGVSGSAGDGGPAVNAQLKNPKSVELYGGYLYTCGVDNMIRRINLSTGVVSRVAGTGTAAYSGDGGPALSATLNGPQRLAIDSQGNVYVADRYNSVIRRIDSGTLVITTVAGTGVAGLSGDGGPATQAMLREARGIALEGDTLLYIADSLNYRVRRLDLVSGFIDTVAGTTRGHSGDDGPAGAAKLDQTFGVTVKPDGNLLIADSFNSVLRLVSGQAPPPPGPVELLSNRSVEASGTGYLGLWSGNDEVTWSAEAGYDGTHSIRIRNTAATSQQAGLNTKPVAVLSTTVGDNYVASVWVRATMSNQAVTLRLRECEPTGACSVGSATATATLVNSDWLLLQVPYQAKRSGDQLKFHVTAENLAPSTSVYADLFSLTRKAAI